MNAVHEFDLIIFSLMKVGSKGRNHCLRILFIHDFTLYGILYLLIVFIQLISSTITKKINDHNLPIKFKTINNLGMNYYEKINKNQKNHENKDVKMIR